MASRVEDYAAIGNGETMALVGRDGSIDWLCLPRFDSDACFSALLGEAENGRWQIRPVQDGARTTRRYRGNTLLLETQFETDEGAVVVIDFMAGHEGVSDLLRLVRGVRGKVSMRTELVVRFDYGRSPPWVFRREDGRLQFVSGPDRLLLDTNAKLTGEGLKTVGVFDVTAGEEVAFSLSWTPSFSPAPPPFQAASVLEEMQAFWSDWASTFSSDGEWAGETLRSLLTLKGLAHRRTGGIVAAATTSLPEKLGGTRNWDYRYCWLRDAAFTLYALINSGFMEEARAWRRWLVRAVAGTPNDLRIMYGVAGERRLAEYELDHLRGYENSTPVRIGNAAAGQFQLDVYGEVMDAMYAARRAGAPQIESDWGLECALMGHLETIWDQPDDGIWEVRGVRQQFTHSKVMAWVAFDRAVRSIEEFGLKGPSVRWRKLRKTIHDQVCSQGFDAERNSFVQAYGSSALDASLLLIPMVGFLPPGDPRVRGTLAAIERDLLRDGLVFRYDTGKPMDGLPQGEGAFLACSFWLVDNYVLQNRLDEARALFRRLLSLRNDVGLLAEEYDPVAKRQLGNFPQAFSHLALVNSAHKLRSASDPARQRARPESTMPVPPPTGGSLAKLG
jgi:GH15 family glucan-1,4-alpha-glucosidase